MVLGKLVLIKRYDVQNSMVQLGMLRRTYTPQLGLLGRPDTVIGLTNFSSSLL